MMDATTDHFAPLPLATLAPTVAAGAAPAGGWCAILPVPLPLSEAIRHRRHGVPSMVWRCCNAAGALLFAVARFDLADGSKEVLPYTCGAERWDWKAPPDRRPLYGLDRLAALPDAPVLVAEGEKAADAAVALFPVHVAVSLQGGGNATGKADWRPLVGRSVAVWPDNDAPGAMGLPLRWRRLPAPPERAAFGWWWCRPNGPTPRMWRTRCRMV